MASQLHVKDSRSIYIRRPCRGLSRSAGGAHTRTAPRVHTRARHHGTAVFGPGNGSPATERDKFLFLSLIRKVSKSLASSPGFSPFPGGLPLVPCESHFRNSRHRCPRGADPWLGTWPISTAHFCFEIRHRVWVAHRYPRHRGIRWPCPCHCLALGAEGRRPWRNRWLRGKRRQRVAGHKPMDLNVRLRGPPGGSWSPFLPGAHGDLALRRPLFKVPPLLLASVFLLGRSV